MDLKKIQQYNMKILGIETSCDETSSSIIEAFENDNFVNVISNETTTSLSLHEKTGGIIPEVAAREQLKYVLPVIENALKKANEKIENIDALAVTIGPGLIGSLLVGIETAKTIAKIYEKPIVPVNHLFGHVYANFIADNKKTDIEFPAIALIASGGHTDLLLMKGHGNFKWLGGTRDDAAGEAFDKIARLLNLPYPGGPIIEKKAEEGNPKKYNLPRPMIASNDLDFSFSGLKTAVLRQVKEIGTLNKNDVNDLSASVQDAIITVLIKKTLKAIGLHNAKSVILSGGVAANKKLRDEFKTAVKDKINLFFPERKFCTDNASMIASYAFFNYKPVDWRKIMVNPELYFD
jgi:N6-L-threonylcarbamoyladenine synthase